MVNDKSGGSQAKQTQIKKYGSEEAYRAEMGRRASLRKTIGHGAFKDPKFAKEAGAKGLEKRWNSGKKDSTQETS